MRRWIALILLAGIVLAVAGAACSNKKSSSGTKAATATSTVVLTVQATTASALTATPVPPSAVGIGATDQVWNSRHKVISSPSGCTSFCDNRYYDQQPGGAARFEVPPSTRDHGLIAFLVIRPRPSVNRDQAIQDVLGQLPTDATQTSFDSRTTECEQLGFQSAVLHDAFQAAGVNSDGRVSVEFSTIGTNDAAETYDTQRINEVIMQSLPPDSAFGDAPC
jgi:hypothetical protein